MHSRRFPAVDCRLSPWSKRNKGHCVTEIVSYVALFLAEISDSRKYVYFRRLPFKFNFFNTLITYFLRHFPVKFRELLIGGSYFVIFVNYLSWNLTLAFSHFREFFLHVGHVVKFPLRVSSELIFLSLVYSRYARTSEVKKRTKKTRKWLDVCGDELIFFKTLWFKERSLILNHSSRACKIENRA